MAGKRTVYIPADVWDQLREAAGMAGARERRPVTVSEYLRRAIASQIEKDERADQRRRKISEAPS